METEEEVSAFEKAVQAVRDLHSYDDGPVFTTAEVRLVLLTALPLLLGPLRKLASRGYLDVRTYVYRTELTDVLDRIEGKA